MNRESRASLRKANNKLADALELDAATFPGLVIECSYYAMHHAAVALLQQRDGSAPLKLNQVVTSFAEFLTTRAEEDERFGRALNRAFNARIVEDYGVLEVADVDEAREIRSQAEDFVEFCERVIQEFS